MTDKRDRVARTLRALFAGAVMASAFGACLPSEIGDDAGAGQSCGSRGQRQCGAGEYCNFPEQAQCGSFDAPGTCADIPRFCTREYAPVCGCDCATYGNACTAAAAGVSVLHRGECPAEEDAGSEEPAASCGGLIGGQCSRGEFCDYPVEATCGAADQPGTCRAIPEICTSILDPVCGCDDKTYGNPCEAARASVSVVKRGACKPEICTAQYDPVCGRDGKTYGNACNAAGAGASIAHDGEC